LKFPRPPVHQVDFYLDLIHGFGREYSNESAQVESRNPAELQIREREIVDIEKWLNRYGIVDQKRMVGVSPSAAYGSSKEWLPELFVELIDRLSNSLPDTQFLFFGSGAEQEKIERICRQCAGSTFNLAGKLSLKQSIAAISRCRGFISNDSGLMHVASVLQIPLIAIFGPTDPELTAPRSGNATCIHRPVECAPCKYRECPIDHRCMTGIQVGDVYDAVMEVLSGRRKN
jgi:heptosyltransferase-2